MRWNMATETKYVKIASIIRKDVEDGVYKPGDRLPVERELQDHFQVSKMTIRHALQLLQQQGVIRIERSRGAFVIDLQVQRSKEILGLTELLEREGLKSHSKVVHLDRISPDRQIQEMMNIKEDDEIYYLHRIRYADDEAIAIEYSYINAKYCPGLEMFNLEEFSLYDIFYEHYKMHIAWAKDEISADNIRGEDAKILLQAKSGPALIVHNTAYDTDDTSIEFTRTIYNYKTFTYQIISTETSKKYRRHF